MTCSQDVVVKRTSGYHTVDSRLDSWTFGHFQSYEITTRGREAVNGKKLQNVSRGEGEGDV